MFKNLKNSESQQVKKPNPHYTTRRRRRNSNYDRRIIEQEGDRVIHAVLNVLTPGRWAAKTNGRVSSMGYSKSVNPKQQVRKVLFNDNQRTRTEIGTRRSGQSRDKTSLHTLLRLLSKSQKGVYSSRCIVIVRRVRQEHKTAAHSEDFRQHSLRV